MDCDQETFADELIELQVVHVACGADLRRMNHDEEMVGINVDPGNVIALPRALDRDRMKSKIVGERPFGGFTPFRYVEPKEPVGPRAKCAQFLEIALAHPALVNP